MAECLIQEMQDQTKHLLGGTDYAVVNFVDLMSDVAAKIESSVRQIDFTATIQHLHQINRLNEPLNLALYKQQ